MECGIDEQGLFRRSHGLDVIGLTYTTFMV